MKIVVNGKLVDGKRSVIDNGREHALVTDLPKAQGGANTGPTALELAVMALAGCFTTIYSVIAANKKVPFESLEVHLEAEKPDKGKTIESVKVKATVVSSDPERARKTWDDMMHVCPVGELFKRAGVKIDVELEVKES